jgi:hypothetical protein
MQKQCNNQVSVQGRRIILGEVDRDRTVGHMEMIHNNRI